MSERLTDITNRPDFELMKASLMKAARYAENKHTAYADVYAFLGLPHDFEKCSLLMSMQEELFDNI